MIVGTSLKKLSNCGFGLEECRAHTKSLQFRQFSLQLSSYRSCMPGHPRHRPRSQNRTLHLSEYPEIRDCCRPRSVNIGSQQNRICSLKNRKHCLHPRGSRVRHHLVEGISAKGCHEAYQTSNTGIPPSVDWNV
jgi:hypothetical protein